MKELEKANRKEQRARERQLLAQQAALDDGEEKGATGEDGMSNPYLEKRREDAKEDSDSDEGGVVKDDVDSDDEPV